MRKLVNLVLVVTVAMAVSCKKDNHVATLPFYVSTMAYNSQTGLTDLTTSHISVTTGRVLYDGDGAASVNKITVNDGNDDYTITITKSDYITYTKVFTRDQLKGFTQSSPLVVTFTSSVVTNGAIQFDGVDDYVDLGNILDNVTLPVTISAWVWLDPTAQSGGLTIFDSQVGQPLYNGFQLSTSIISHVGCGYGDGAGENNIAYRRNKSTPLSPTLGRWVNYTAVIRGAVDMSLYFNGVDVGGNYDGSSNLPMQNNSPLENAVLGYNVQNGATYRFKGKMDEIKIWNRSLTADEVQTLIFKKLDASASGLIGYWNFDETSGDKVMDLSSNHFDGLLKGNPTRVVSDVPMEE